MYEHLIKLFHAEQEQPKSDIVVEEDWFGRYGPDGPSGAANLAYDDAAAAAAGTSAASGSPQQQQQQPVRRFTITNQNRVQVQVITYGATVTSFKVPGRDGELYDVVLGFDKLQDYYSHTCYFGGTIGRVANRISNGKFVLSGRQFQLACNNGPNHLHGGNRGFDKVLWDSHVDGSIVVLTYRSKDNEEGYPGELTARVSFELTSHNELVIRYNAKATKLTPVNLTNHSYFNLGGQGSGDIKDHIITLNADHYLPKNDASIPTGRIEEVEGTLFDLRNPVRLGDVLPQIPDGGFDHNFCIKEDSESDDEGRRMVARVVNPNNGIVLDVWSTLPGVQFYTANFLPTDDSLLGKGGNPYRQHYGIALETQYFPDSVNKPNFPNCIFGPEEPFESVTIFRFSTM